MSQPLLKVTELAKSFSGVWALSNAQLTVGPGEIHALLGENGAGKSTLLKALAGAQPQTRGEIWFNGETLPVDDSPVERQNKGIITIYQEFNLLPNMTVAENMFLGREPRKRNLIVDEKAVNQEAQVILDYLQLNVAPTTPVARLSVAQQQMVEIARALTLNARLIIMDEPSAALSDSEVESLHRVVRELKNRGVSIIYVTHRLHEVFQLCDRFTVFQDGRFTGTGAVAETNVEQLIRLMVGRDVAFNRRPASETHHEDKPIRLAVKGLSREKPPLDPHGIALHDISFHVHAGEVLGIAGLDGSGRTEVLENLFGAMTKESGTIRLHGKEIKNKTPREAIKNGFALLTEERRATGIFGIRDIKENTVISNLKSYLAGGFCLSEKKMKEDTDWAIQAMHIKTPSQSTQIRSLSGGNQQKVIIGRWLLTKPEVLLLDEPTRGIDVGAKYEIYQLILDLAKEGKGVIMVSSEMPELLGICDRILVMSGGVLAGEVDARNTSQEEILTLAAKYV